MTRPLLILLAALAIVAGLWALTLTHGDQDGLGDHLDGMHEYRGALGG